MNHPGKQKLIKETILCFITTLILGTFIVPSFALANHGGRSDGPPPLNDENRPCSAIIDGERAERVDQYVGLGIISFPGGIYVPVYDSAVARALGDLADILNDLGDQNQDLAELTSDNEFNNRRAMLYLRALCQKEYEEDHTLQHAWRDAISGFIDRSLYWISNAYNQNPMFVSNPYVYYRNIEVGVVNAYVQEIEQHITNNELDQDKGRRLIRQIHQQTLDSISGPGSIIQDWSNYTSAGANTQKDRFDDPNDFSWGGHYGATQIPLNSDASFATALMQELEDRKNQVREVESQKLNWGRGFFPWEYCGQEVFSANVIDIRTCMTFTPGAVVQDVTTWLLSSGLRQMELADEYEEWVSGVAIAAMDSVYAPGGLVVAEEYTPQLGNQFGAIPQTQMGDLYDRIANFDQNFRDQYIAEYGLESNNEKASEGEIDLFTLP